MGEQVFVWPSRVPDRAADKDHVATLARLRRWRNEIAGQPAQSLPGPLVIQKLSPTTHSLLHA